MRADSILARQQQMRMLPVMERNRAKVQWDLSEYVCRNKQFMTNVHLRQQMLLKPLNNLRAINKFLQHGALQCRYLEIPLHSAKRSPRHQHRQHQVRPLMRRRQPLRRAQSRSYGRRH